MDSIEQIKQILDSQPEQRVEQSLSVFELISQTTKQFFEYAVLTKQCQHFTKPVELKDIMRTHKCSECGKQINNTNDLIKSPTEWALTYFSEDQNDIGKRRQCKTYKCCVVAGYYFHYYYRNKKFSQILQRNDDLIKLLVENRNDQNNFLRLCSQDPKIYLKFEKIQLFNNHKLKLLQGLHRVQEICQLDIYIHISQFVFWINNCQHPECYELSSLLQYAAEIVQTESSENNARVNKKMKCCKDTCKVEFQMEVNQFGSNLVLDYELLTALRQSPAYCLNFQVSTQNLTLKNDFAYNNGIDRYIQIYHQIKNVKKDLEAFQNDVLIRMSSFLQSHDKIQEFQIRNKYRIIKNIKLSDPFISNVIEYPSRCVECPLEICSDLRTYLCEILTNFKQDDIFQCPLCKHKFNFQLNQTTKLIQSIYVDFNLQQQMINYESHRNEKKIDYLGDQYLLEELIKRAESQDFLQQILQKNGLTKIQYTQYNCVKTKKRLNHPLKLPNCVQGNYISFQTLYDELVAVDFDYNKGLNFCSCSYCIQNPISMKKTSKDILIYEPLLQFVLSHLSRQDNQNQQKIVFDVTTRKLLSKGEETQMQNEDDLSNHVSQELDSIFDKTKFQQLLYDVGFLKEQFRNQEPSNSDFMQQFTELQTQVRSIESKVLNCQSQFSQFQQVIGARLDNIEKQLLEMQNEKILLEILDLRKLSDRALLNSEQNRLKLKNFKKDIPQFMTKEEFMNAQVKQIENQSETQQHLNYLDQKISIIERDFLKINDNFENSQSQFNTPIQSRQEKNRMRISGSRNFANWNQNNDKIDRYKQQRNINQQQEQLPKINT